MSAKPRAGAFLVTVFAMLPLVVFAAEASSPVSRQPAIIGLSRNTPMLGMAMLGSRLIGVGAYGKIVKADFAVEGGLGQMVQAPSPLDVTLTSIASRSDGVCFVGGHETTILRSIDSGETWEVLRTDPLGSPILAMIFLKEGIGVAVGGNGQVLTSEDSGANWSLRKIMIEEDGLDFDPQLFDVAQLSNGKLVASGEHGYVFFSDDLGQTWHEKSTGYEGPLFSIVEEPNGDILAFGMSGNFVRSGDEGTNWVRGRLGIEDAILSANIVDGDVVLGGTGGLFAVLSQGALHVTRLPTELQVADFIRSASGKYVLSTNLGLRVISLEQGIQK